METENMVNDMQEQTVDAQEVQDTGESQVEQPVSEPAEQKPVQTPEENAKFAEMRRAREAAEAEARQVKKDYEIARKYGRDYGVFSEQDIAENYAHLGITDLAQFEAAVERQKMIDDGYDPDIITEKVEHLPEVVKAREQEFKTRNYSEFAEFYRENIGQLPDFSELPKPVLDAFAKNESMKVAFMEWDYKQMTEKRKAEETNKKNADSSPGSVTGNGSIQDDFISFDTFEANKHDQKWVNKNYNKIMESRAKW
jgi:hypothetical protein